MTSNSWMILAVQEHSSIAVGYRATLAMARAALRGEQWSEAEALLMRAGAIAGVNMRPAKPGETITLYGIGFGPVSPGTAAGSIAAQTNSVTNPVTVQFGSTPAQAQYAGLAPGFVGLYQFNVKVPNVLDGDWALNVQVNGAPVAPDVYLTTGQ